jgi:predicted ATPase
MLAWVLWILGYPEQALQNVLHAISKATEQGDPYTIAFAHYVRSAVHLLRGEFGDSLEHADKSLALSTEHGINLYALYSRFGRGCALSKMKQEEQAISEVQEGIDKARQSELGYMRGFMLGWLATLQADTGDPETALATIDEALQQISDVVGHAWEAELRRLYGTFLLVARPGAADQAERSYNDAITVAKRQRAHSLELRASTSLARLWRDQGKRAEARDLLAPIYGCFTEGFDTPDLKEAKALLEELS